MINLMFWLVISIFTLVIIVSNWEREDRYSEVEFNQELDNFINNKLSELNLGEDSAKKTLNSMNIVSKERVENKANFISLNINRENTYDNTSVYKYNHNERLEIYPIANNTKEYQVKLDFESTVA